MNKLRKLIQSPKLQLAACLYYALFQPLLIFYLIGATFAPEKANLRDDLGGVAAFAVLFFPAFLINELLGKTMPIWKKRLLNLGYYVTLAFTVFCGVEWYFYPDNGRLEPLTLMLGFVATWTTFVKNRAKPEVTIVAAQPG